MEGGENHNFDLESALRALAAKREAEGMFSCSTGLQLQQCTVLLSTLTSKGTCHGRICLAHCSAASSVNAFCCPGSTVSGAFAMQV